MNEASQEQGGDKPVDLENIKATLGALSLEDQVEVLKSLPYLRAVMRKLGYTASRRRPTFEDIVGPEATARLREQQKTRDEDARRREREAGGGTIKDELTHHWRGAEPAQATVVETEATTEKPEIHTLEFQRRTRKGALARRYKTRYR